MEEIIKYFQDIEARLAALEAAQQEEPAQNAKIEELTKLTALLVAKNTVLEANLTEQNKVIDELKAKIAELEARPVVAPEKEPAVVPVSVDEDETVAIDEETGEPELEVEFVEEPEVAEEAPVTPVVSDPLLEAEIIKEEPAITVEETAETVPAVEEPTVEETPVVEPAAPVSTVADTMAQGESISSVVPKIADIRKGISISDRFLFQRELFGGNGELMSKTIDKINSLSSLSEAEAYIAANFNWNKESNAYELFQNLLKRRF